MKTAIRIALAVGLLAGIACHKDRKQAQLEALDKAYRSGVFTREEYDARKQALLGTPAAAPPPAAAAPAADAPPAPAGALPAVEVPVPAGAVPESSPPVAPSLAAPPAPPPAAPPKAMPVAPPSAAPPAPPPAAPPKAKPVPPAAAPAEPEEPAPAPLAGCEDAESRAGGPKGVIERFFPAAEDAVRKAARQALRNLDFALQQDSAHQMEATKRRHLSAVVGAGGEHLILHFSPAGRNGIRGTLVTGETRKTLVGRLAQKPWTAAVMAQIGCNLRK